VWVYQSARELDDAGKAIMPVGVSEQETPHEQRCPGRTAICRPLWSIDDSDLSLRIAGGWAKVAVVASQALYRDLVGPNAKIGWRKWCRLPGQYRHETARPGVSVVGGEPRAVGAGSSFCTSPRSKCRTGAVAHTFLPRPALTRASILRRRQAAAVSSI